LASFLQERLKISSVGNVKSVVMATPAKQAKTLRERAAENVGNPSSPKISDAGSPYPISRRNICLRLVARATQLRANSQRIDDF